MTILYYLHRRLSQPLKTCLLCISAEVFQRLFQTGRSKTDLLPSPTCFSPRPQNRHWWCHHPASHTDQKPGSHLSAIPLAVLCLYIVSIASLVGSVSSVDPESALPSEFTLPRPSSGRLYLLPKLLTDLLLNFYPSRHLRPRHSKLLKTLVF